MEPLAFSFEWDYTQVVDLVPTSPTQLGYAPGPGRQAINLDVGQRGRRTSPMGN